MDTNTMQANVSTNNSAIDELNRLKAENEALKAKLLAAKAPHALSFKVSEKGAVSIYGIGRFPVTLYKSQIDRLFSDETVKSVREFVVAHPELKVKE